MNIYGKSIAIGLILMTIYLMIRFFRVKRSKLQRQGLTTIKAIKQLIVLIQQHRGMTSAYLNGNEQVQFPLTLVRKDIDRHIHCSAQCIREDNERWQFFLEHWFRFSSIDINLTIDNSFTQHTKIIANLLYLVQEEAEKSLLSSEFIVQFPQAGYVWRELINTTEIIGQARAIGVAVATLKYCSNINKMRLTFLKQQISDMNDKVLSKLSCLSLYIDEHQQLLQSAIEQTALLAQTIEKELLSNEQIVIDQQVYFDQVSAVIESIDNVFEHQLMQISKTLVI